jgi:hypothetical protein
LLSSLLKTCWISKLLPDKGVILVQRV